MLSGCGCFPSICPGAGTDLGLSPCPHRKRSDPCTASAPGCTVLVQGETSWFSLLRDGWVIFLFAVCGFQHLLFPASLCCRERKE